MNLLSKDLSSMLEKCLRTNTVLLLTFNLGSITPNFMSLNCGVFWNENCFSYEKNAKERKDKETFVSEKSLTHLPKQQGGEYYTSENQFIKNKPINLLKRRKYEFIIVIIGNS